MGSDPDLNNLTLASGNGGTSSLWQMIGEQPVAAQITTAAQQWMIIEDDVQSALGLVELLTIELALAVDER